MLSEEGNETGAPNDGFLKYIENTFWIFIKYLSSIEMHSKWRYQICISVFGHSRGT